MKEHIECAVPVNHTKSLILLFEEAKPKPYLEQKEEVGDSLSAHF